MLTGVSAIPRISNEATTRCKSVAFLCNCAKENPALVLRKNCKPPSIHPSIIKALALSIDFDKSDPLYLVRLMKLVDESSRDKIMPLLISKSGSVKRRALQVCWDQEIGCPTYVTALNDYVLDTIYSYTALKAWFEQKVFRVIEWAGKGFAMLKIDGSLKQNSEHDITSTFKDVYYNAEEWEKPDSEESTDVMKKRFITRWLNDPLKRVYNKVDCNPSCTKPSPQDVYNIWPGMRAESLPPVPEEEVLTLIEPIVNHIRIVITDNNEEQLRFMLAWFAQMVKFPEITTCVAILLQGEQGVGKNAPLDFFREYVLGDQVSFQTSDPAEVFEKHSICRNAKVMIQIDEANGLVSSQLSVHFVTIASPSLTIVYLSHHNNS